MINAKINNEINLTYPEGYNEMSEAELTRYFGVPDNRWGVFDPGRHIVISVGWNKPGFFSSMGDADSFLLYLLHRYERRYLMAAGMTPAQLLRKVERKVGQKVLPGRKA